MAQIPYSGGVPSVEPAPTPPSDYQHIEATPQDFGAQVGQAEQQFGAQAEEAGTFYASVAATHAANDFLDYSDKLLHGDPNDPSNQGLLNLKGSDAMRAYPQVAQQIEAHRKEVMAGLNPLAQQEFQRQTLYLARWAMNSAGQYARQQQDVWAAAGAKAQEDLTTRQIGTAAMQGDVPTLDVLRNRMRDAYVKQAESRLGTGLSDEMKTDLVAQADAAWTSNQVRALAHSDPLKASKVLDANASLLPGPIYDQLKREVGGSANIAIGNQMLGDARAGTGPHVGGGTTGAMIAGGAIASKIADNAPEFGVKPDLALRTAAIESKMGQNVGSRGNIFQLGSNEWAEAGGGDMADPDKQIANGLKWLARTRDGMSAALGREPTDEEIYLGHQQGVAGATALIQNPNTPAGQLVAPQNIRANGGDPNAPASVFVQHWQQVYDRTGAPAQTGAAAAPVTFSAWGDSIAAQQIRHGVAGQEDAQNKGQPIAAGKTAAVGDTPERVLQRITSADPAQFAGKTIFLSSGASNDPSQVNLVADQVDALKKAGATNIVIPGVGPAVEAKAPNTNAQLKLIADKTGATFFEPNIKWQADGIHPAEVDKLREQAAQALAAHAPGAAAQAPAVQVTPPVFDTQHAEGMTKPGNLDPWNRPVLHNPDGSYSTTSSMSVGTDAGEVLIPTVVNGKRLSDEDALKHFHETGENLGTFASPEAADRYATLLHNAQASMYDEHGNPKAPAQQPMMPGLPGAPNQLAAPDQLVGHPAPVPSVVPSVVPPGGTPTPAAVAPPGMQDLANAEAELAQHHAQTIERLGADPRAQSNPEAYQHALAKAETEFRDRKSALDAQKQALTETRNAVMDDYVKAMAPGAPVDPSLPGKIAADGRLDPASRENLYHLIENRQRSTADGDTAKYGSHYFDVLQRVAAPDSDPNKIRDPTQLLQMTLPKPDGSQDITTAGYDKLRAEMQHRKTPEGVGDSEIRKGALAYAKHQLSFEADYGTFKIPDPKGMDAFNIGFLPAFYKYYDSGIAAGKSPGELLAKDKLDALMAPFRRTDAERARDMVGAEATATGNQPAQPANAPVDLSTQAGIVAAYRAGKLSRDQAAKELVDRGFAAPAIAPPQR